MCKHKGESSVTMIVTHSMWGGLFWASSVQLRSHLSADRSKTCWSVQPFQKSLLPVSIEFWKLQHNTINCYCSFLPLMETYRLQFLPMFFQHLCLLLVCCRRIIAPMARRDYQCTFCVTPPTQASVLYFAPSFQIPLCHQSSLLL